MSVEEIRQQLEADNFNEPALGFYQQGRFTSGEWKTEAESCAYLDNVLERIDKFNVYREVRGYYLQPRLGQQLCTPRIDRVLVPKAALKSAGWSYGPIAIECKRSEENIGPPLAQLLDYSRAAWQIQPGIWVVPEWTFLWPGPLQLGGPILSVFAQNRLGIAISTQYAALNLSSGQNLATFQWDGTVRIGAGLNGAGRNGKKAGSR